MPARTMAGRIVEERVRLRWTQGGLAQRAGLNQATLARIERGDRKTPAAMNVGRIAVALDVPTEYLIFGARWSNSTEDATLLPYDEQPWWVQVAFADTWERRSRAIAESQRIVEIDVDGQMVPSMPLRLWQAQQRLQTKTALLAEEFGELKGQLAKLFSGDDDTREAARALLRAPREDGFPILPVPPPDIDFTDEPEHSAISRDDPA